MEIALHIGANCTDDDLLLKSLMKNTEGFAEQGIRVPGPGKYRRLLRETIQNLKGMPPAPDTRDILLDAILDDEQANRVVLSNSAFICISNRIFEEGKFYNQLEPKILGILDLFPNDTLEIYIGLRNPATWVPACFAESKQDNFAEYLGGIMLSDIRWHKLVSRIRAVAPRASITVWCNEDTPLIWSQLIREISGVDPLTRISGGFDLLNTIMSPEGMQRFLTYLKSHPPQTEVQKRRIIAAFLEKYALEDEVVEEFELPGWTTEIVDRLTEQYDDDIYQLERMAGIHFIAP